MVIASAAAAEALSYAADKAAGYFGDETHEEIKALPPQNIINNITLNPTQTVTQENRDKLVTASEVIAASEGGANSLKQKLTADAIADKDYDLSQTLSGSTPQQARAAQILAQGNAKPDAVLTADELGKVKALRRKATDRYYCSTEYHEWKYHVTSGEKAKVLSAMTAVETGDGVTHGAWVDAKDYRKAVELYRRIVRAISGPRFTSLLTVLGTNKQAQLTQLLLVPATKAVFDAVRTNNPQFLADD